MNNLFTSSLSVRSSRILYTPSPFARSSLLHLQEVGSLTAIKAHTSKREKLQSYLCFMVEDGEGELVYEVIPRTQTENFIRLRCGKTKPQHVDYPYSYKRHGENWAQFGILGSTHRN